MLLVAGSQVGVTFDGTLEAVNTIVSGAFWAYYKENNPSSPSSEGQVVNHPKEVRLQASQVRKNANQAYRRALFVMRCLANMGYIAAFAFERFGGSEKFRPKEEFLGGFFEWANKFSAKGSSEEQEAQEAFFEIARLLGVTVLSDQSIQAIEHNFFRRVYTHLPSHDLPPNPLLPAAIIPMCTDE